MKTTRVAIIAIAVITLAGVVLSLRLLTQGQAVAQRNEVELQRRADLLGSLRAERDRLILLKKVSAGEDGSGGVAGDELGELEKEAKRLTEQKEELESKSKRASVRTIDTNSVGSPAEYGMRNVVSDSRSMHYREALLELAGGPEDEGREHRRKDAQNLAQAARSYAREHDGQFPNDFEMVKPYLFDTYAPPRAHEFELVFHGTTNDLAGIPPQAVALVRQRQAWMTPTGKLGRIYVMADGILRVVEAEDNFLNWERAHVVSGRGGRD